ncbi:hypothetical protein [Massilia aerilata]|uniref:Beta-glucosidase n=1 Tax=Massilia aerilata TaxID=453817 RepID=A0ABW0RXI2_9BURK
MKKNWKARIAVAAALAAFAGAAFAGGDADIAQRVEALLLQMTIEEKAGQLNQS